MKKFLLGVLGVTAIGLAGCSDDVSRPKTDEIVEVDQTRYLAVAISSPTNYMTRAEGDENGETGEDETPAPVFEDGTADESAVSSVTFVFYDAEGNPTASTTIGAQATQKVPENANVTSFFASVVPVNMSRGQKVPQYVMCFVNPVEIGDLANMTLAQLDQETRSAVQTGAGFAMSNSVYYGFNAITGQSNVRMMATPILESKLFDTEEEATNALTTDAILNIYVERYAAKIGLTMASTAVGDGYPVKVPNADGTSFTDAKINFTPEFWRPNAIDLDTYVTKAFATSPNADGTFNPAVAPAFGTVNDAFEKTGMPGDGINGWNDPTNYRSYWGCSPSYYANSYPNCSDNITDVTDADGKYPYALKYFTYKEAKSGKDENGNTIGVEGMKWNDGFSGYFYSRETTASITNIHGGTKDNKVNSKAVVASAVIVGKYAINATLTDADTEGTFYLYGKNAGVDIYYKNYDSLKEAMIKNQFVLFTDDSGTTPVTDPEYFNVEHPSINVRKDYNNNVSGRLVTLQLAADKLDGKNPVYYYDETANDGNGGYVGISATSENLDDLLIAANQLLWTSTSTAQVFYHGLAFFSVPIRHLGWDKNVDPNNKLLTETTTSGRPSVYNWANLRLGDLGVVRNHVYNLEIGGISGLGVGLASEDQPMVPPMDPENYYVAARLNILAWRIVPKQSVTL